MNRLSSLLLVLGLFAACHQPPPPPSVNPRPTDAPLPLPTGPIDESQAARDQFIQIWKYETIEQHDVFIGEEKAYTEGLVMVCAALVAGQVEFGDLPEQVASQGGHTGSGAQAVIAAAVRTLCDGFDPGYLTFFDRQVRQAQAQIEQGWGQPVSEYETGITAKKVCEYLDHYPPTPAGLGGLMHSEGTPSGAPIKLTVRAVVNAHCVNHELGWWWFDDSTPA